MKKSKELFTLLIILTFCFGGLCLRYWMEGTPFIIFGGDLTKEYYPFYYELKNLIMNFFESGHLPFYSWNFFLGNNYLASKTFYVYGDIYNYLTMLIDSHFYTVFQNMTHLKYVVAGFAMYFYLGYCKYSDKTKIYGSIAYAFSSWAVFYAEHLSFLSFYSFLPIYFLGMDQYIKENKKVLFIFSTFLLACTNYYFFITISIFSVIYYLYQYYLHHGDYKGVVRNTLPIIGYYFIGAAMAGVLLVPSAIYLLDNDRLGGSNFSLLYENVLVPLRMLISMIVPGHSSLAYDTANIFSTYSYSTGEMCLWAGSSIALFLPQFLVDKDSKYKQATIALYVIFIVLMSPFGSKLMHGLSEVSFRWFLLFIFMNIVISCKYFDHVEFVQLKQLRRTFFTWLSMLVAVPLLAIIVSNQMSQIALFQKQIVVFALCFLALVVNYFLIVNRKQFFLIAFTVIELILAGFYHNGVLRYTEYASSSFASRATGVLGETETINKYLDSIDEENYGQFYRIYADQNSIYWGFSLNMNVLYEIQGVSTYDSMYSPSLNDMKKIVKSGLEAINSEGWKFNITDSNLLSFLSCKYAFTTSEEEIPFSNYQVLDTNYQYGIVVSENLDYRPVGTVYHQLTTYSQLENTQSFNSQLLLDQLIVHDKDAEILKEYTSSIFSHDFVNEVAYEGNSLYTTLISSSKGVLVLSIPYDKGWKVLVNGTEVETYQVNGGMIGVPLDAGEHVVEMYFVPSGFKIGALLSLLGFIGYFLLIVVARKNKRGKYL